MAKADIPTEVLQRVAAMLYSDLGTLKNGSLVNTIWRLVFQEVLFSRVRIFEPGNELDDNKQLLWFLNEPEASRQRVASMVKELYVGGAYNFDKMQYGRSTTIEKDYLSVFEAMSNLTSLNFSSSTFAWERLDDADLEAFIRVLKLPELKRVTFFCFPGCYLPLSLFAFCGESLACLEIVDISPEPVNEAHSNPIYDELMNRLLALYQGFRPPSLSLSYLLLRGLGLALNFLEFMERHRLGWSDPNLLTRLDLDLTNTYYPTNLNKPNQAVIAGKILMRFGAALRHLRLHIECDPLNDSPLQARDWINFFGAGMRALRNVETVKLTLTVNTMIGTDAYAFAEYAWARLSLALEALPRDNMIHSLLITCEFSLAKFRIDQGWTFKDQDRCMQAINQWLWKTMDGITREPKYSSIQRWDLTMTFYWGNSLEARRENPNWEIIFSQQATTSLPWYCKRSPINASVYWDNELLRELSNSSTPSYTNTSN